MHSDSYWHSVASAYSTGAMLSETGPLAKPMGKGWPNQPTITMFGRDGYPHLVTQNMVNVAAECQRLIITGERITMQQMADRLHVCRETVRRSLQRLAAWGLIGLATWRGRGGGMILRDPQQFTNWLAAARIWRQKLRAAWLSKLARLNATSTLDGGSKYPTSIDVAFKAAERERARNERDDAIEQYLVGMRKGSNKRVPCPGHGGKDANLSLWRRQDGSLGLKCWSMRCEERAIKEAVEPWRPV